MNQHTPGPHRHDYGDEFLHGETPKRACRTCGFAVPSRLVSQLPTAMCGRPVLEDWRCNRAAGHAGDCTVVTPSGTIDTAASHTPRPWYVVFSAGAYRIQTEAEIICEIGDRHEWANASLIAAAPEMLASLKALVAIIGNMSHTDANHDHREAFYAARALLAKIEGA